VGQSVNEAIDAFLEARHRFESLNDPDVLGPLRGVNARAAGETLTPTKHQHISLYDAATKDHVHTMCGRVVHEKFGKGDSDDAKTCPSCLKKANADY